MKRKIPVLIVLFVFVSACLIWTFWTTHAKYYPKQVLWLPDGFITLQESTENAKNIIEYMFFEEYVSLLDMDGGSVGGALVRDRSFIISYQGVYYINAEKYYTALEKAKQVAEQRNRTYSLGEEVELRGIINGELATYTVEINAIEEETVEKMATYKIKFMTNPELTDSQKVQLFDYVETERGTMIKDFTLVDKETVQFKLPADEEINMLSLRSPGYANCIRKYSLK